MKMILCTLAGLIIVCATDARMITLLVDSQNPSRTLQIKANESVIVRQLFAGGGFEAHLRIGGHSINFASGLGQRLPIVGPAEIELRSPASDSNAWSYVTFEILTDTFPPDKTIIIPEGTGARIALECSTNLTQWTEVYSATHTNSPSNKFFRIKAERIP